MCALATARATGSVTQMVGTGGAGTPPDFVSTGHLPAPETVQRLIEEALDRFAPVRHGELSDVYPTLQRADPEAFGICVAAASGAIYSVGDVTVPFDLMSVAKPFTFALLCDRVGPDVAQRAIGANATGLPFSSLEAIERGTGGRTNPMVNPGAIATVSALVDAAGSDPWTVLLDGLSAFAGRALEVDDETYECASETNLRNREIAQRLGEAGALVGDPHVALDLYTRQSCVSVTAADLAVMGATLAHGGVNPTTGDRVIDRASCRCTLAVMATAGMYETSGDWLYEVGLPAKSGIGGGIVTVSPGKGALGTYSPRLDDAGNSVRGQRTAAFLARSLGLDVFTSSDEG
jgi:glutaminase